jgi:hypothetical protein
MENTEYNTYNVTLAQVKAVLNKGGTSLYLETGLSSAFIKAQKSDFLDVYKLADNNQKAVDYNNCSTDIYGCDIDKSGSSDVVYIYSGYSFRNTFKY